MNGIDLNRVASTAYYDKGYYNRAGSMVKMGRIERLIRELFWWLPLESATTKCLRLSLEHLYSQLTNEEIQKIEVSARKLATFSMTAITPNNCLWSVRERIATCRNQALDKLYPLDQSRLAAANSYAEEVKAKAEEAGKAKISLEGQLTTKISALEQAEKKAKDAHSDSESLRTQYQGVLERLESIQKQYDAEIAKGKNHSEQDQKELQDKAESAIATLASERAEWTKVKAQLESERKAKEDEAAARAKQVKELNGEIDWLKVKLEEKERNITELTKPKIAPSPASAPSFAFSLTPPASPPEKLGKGSLPTSPINTTRPVDGGSPSAGASEEETKSRAAVDFIAEGRLDSNDKGNGKVVFVTFIPGVRPRWIFEGIKPGFKEGDFIIYPNSWKKGAYKIDDIQALLKLKSSHKNYYADNETALKAYEEHLVAYRAKMGEVFTLLKALGPVTTPVTIDVLRTHADAEANKIIAISPERAAFKTAWNDAKAKFAALAEECDKITKALDAEATAIGTQLKTMFPAKPKQEHLERRIIVIVNQHLFNETSLKTWSEAWAKEKVPVIYASARIKAPATTLSSVLQETLS